MTKAATVRRSKAPMAPRTHTARRVSRCRRCPFCAPSGACLDTRIKSGRCGDWVFYLLRGKQLRHLWVKPRDPRTPSQRYWRARLTVASRKYSDALTDDQQNACIAAGARRHSRLRLGQSGPLTGQQWWVRSQCAGEAEGTMRHAQTATKPLQTQGISLPAWEPHRSTSVVPPEQHRGSTPRASSGWRKSEIRSPKPERRPNTETPKTLICPGAWVSVTPSLVPRISSRFRAPVFGIGRSAPWHAVRVRPGRRRLCMRASGSRAGGVEADLRHRGAAVQWERGPPEQEAEMVSIQYPA
jgi:hypothetical protein